MSAGPVVTVDPAMCFGRPAVRGVSVEIIAELVWVGEDIATLTADYALTREQVLVACWFAGTYGVVDAGRTARGHVVYGRVWRDRWADWADAQAVAMWHGNWDDVTDPPTREGER